MTCIAANFVEMAGDTQISFADDGIKDFVPTKLIRVGVEIVGYAGDSEDGWKVIDFLRDKGRWPKVTDILGRGKKAFEDDFEALVLSPAGLFGVDQSLSRWRVETHYWAVGSGKKFAIAAFKRGASPYEAVDAARQSCLYTGGEITVERLSPAET